jgi:general secretion pathway protein J
MRSRGFSLLEVLVAVAIFAVLAVLAYGGLDAVARARAQTAEAAQRLAAVQSAVAGLERDLREALPRPVRGNSGELLPALIGSGSALELSHAGFASPLTEASAMLSRTAWVVVDGELRRVRWPVMDRASATRGTPRGMLAQTGQLRFRYLDAAANWRDSWPPRDGPDALPERLPRAVEFVLSGTDFGTLSRRVVLVAPVEIEAAR